MTTPLTDWAGNEIKDGQQIVIVDITDYKWVIKSELEIKMDDVFFISLIKALYTTNFLEDKKPFTYIGDDNIKRSYPILCIKGLSDNEEVFYLEYFKVK